jgi:hypothetical protein
MSTRVTGSVLLLVALVFSLNVGAQDPPQPAPGQAAQVDLSGTYTGTFDCEPAGLMGESTLTITGNQFTTADGKTGRIVASPSGGYTAVAFQVGEMAPAATTGAAATPATTPQIFSLRARKQGTRLTLTAAPGTNIKCSFTTGRTARGRRTRTPAATGTEVANPAPPPMPTTTQPTEAPIPAQTPSPSPSPTPTPSPEPQPSPEPEPSPMPTPAPTPMPSPTPVPNPSPMPSPTASPTPSPTPGPGRGR